MSSLPLTFLDKLTTGVLDAGRARLATTSRVRAIPHALLVTAAVALEGIGHGDQRVYDFRCPWRDLGCRRRDTEKTRSPGRAGIHVHVQIVHGLRQAFTIYLTWKHEQWDRCVKQAKLIKSKSMLNVIGYFGDKVRFF